MSSTETAAATHTERRIKKILAEQLGLREEKINNTDHLESDLGADSLDLVEIIISIEDEFELDISDDDAESVKTAQQAIDLMNRLAPTIL